MIGAILIRAHQAFMVLCGKTSILTQPSSPAEDREAALRAVQRAKARGDTRALHDARRWAKRATTACLRQELGRAA